MAKVFSGRLRRASSCIPHSTPPLPLQLLATDADCARFRARVVCEEPNEHFGRFAGNMYLERQQPAPAGEAQSRDEASGVAAAPSGEG